MTHKGQLKIAFRLELVGLLLLLAASGAQLFTADWSSLVLRSDLYEISHKLDTLWIFTNDLGKAKLQVDDKVLSRLNELSVRYWELTGNTKRAEAQGAGGFIVYLAFYVLGSFTLVSGRYLERQVQLSKEP